MPPARFRPGAQMFARRDRWKFRRTVRPLARFETGDQRVGIGTMKKHEGVAIFVRGIARGIDDSMRRRTKHAVGLVRNKIAGIDDGRTGERRRGDPAAIGRLNFQTALVVLKQ